MLCLGLTIDSYGTGFRKDRSFRLPSRALQKLNIYLALVIFDGMVRRLEDDTIPNLIHDR